MFPELTTERFILKQVQPGDQQFIFEGLSDPIATPYYGVYYKSFEETKTQLDWYEKSYNDGTGIHWKIAEKASGKSVGVISVYYYKPEHKKAEVDDPNKFQKLVYPPLKFLSTFARHNP